MFLLQVSSSREAAREMSRPMFWKNLKCLFPELEEVPHHDTLKRLQEQIDVAERHHGPILGESTRKAVSRSL